MVAPTETAVVASGDGSVGSGGGAGEVWPACQTAHSSTLPPVWSTNVRPFASGSYCVRGVAGPDPVPVGDGPTQGV
jgi:hypothetical protein